MRRSYARQRENNSHDRHRGRSLEPRALGDVIDHRFRRDRVRSRGTTGAPAAQAPAPAAAPPATRATAPAAVERIADGADQLTHGKYLVETIAGCGNCHTPHLADGSLDPNMAFAGAFVIEEPVFKAYARNITPDMETGIGSWTDEQIVNAIRNGQKRDGTFSGPADVVRLVQADVGHRRARDRRLSANGEADPQRGARRARTRFR